jgi:peptidoglycan/LPS O-acetylase OafA/YrhL
VLDRHNNFDLIRLLAAAQVVYVHAARDLKLATPAAVDWLAAMFPGVAVFFVISGFLVTKSLVAGGGALGPYAVKRALRIYPGLWVNFIVVLVLLYGSGALAPADIPTSKFLFYQLGQFVIGAEPYGRAIAGPIYHWGDFYTSYPNPALWTIPVELGFYVLVPLVFCALVRRSIAATNAVILISAAGSLAIAVLSAHLLRTAPHSIVTGGVGNGPLPYFWIFLLGAGAYLNWERLRALFVGRFAPWFAAYLIIEWVSAGFGASGLDFVQISGLAVLKMGLLAGTVLAFAHSHVGLARVLRGNDLSYGLYLYHLPFFATLSALGVVGRGYLWVVGFGGALSLAAFSWFLVERRFLRLKSTLEKRMPSMRAAPLDADRRRSVRPTA